MNPVDTIAEWGSLVIWRMMFLLGGVWAIGRTLYRSQPAFPWLHAPSPLPCCAPRLASPGARNITGQTINVDGGLVMH